MADNPSEASDNPTEKQKSDSATPERLFAGKYRSLDDFERGYWELHKEGLRQREKAIQVEAQLNAMRQVPKNDEDLEALKEAGVPVDALENRLRGQVMGWMQEALQPAIAAQSAEADLAEAYQDFPGNSEIAKAVSKDPMLHEEYKNLLGSNPKAAMALGYHAWRAAKPAAATPDPVIDAGKRTNAGTPSAQKQPPEDSSFSQEKYRELLNYGKATNDWGPFTRYRFSQQQWYKDMVEGQGK